MIPVGRAPVVEKTTGCPATRLLPVHVTTAGVAIVIVIVGDWTAEAMPVAPKDWNDRFRSVSVAIDEVIVLAESAVAPMLFGVVDPIVGGLARYVENPVPEIAPEAEREVNAPLAAAVLPMAGGLAKSDVIPEPDTVLEAESVVNAPVPGAVEPIEGGDAK